MDHNAAHPSFNFFITSLTFLPRPLPRCIYVVFLQLYFDKLSPTLINFCNFLLLNSSLLVELGWCDPLLVQFVQKAAMAQYTTDSDHSPR